MERKNARGWKEALRTRSKSNQVLTRSSTKQKNVERMNLSLLLSRRLQSKRCQGKQIKMQPKKQLNLLRKENWSLLKMVKHLLRMLKEKAGYRISQCNEKG